MICFVITHLTRGDRPPIDPLVESWILERAGLDESAISNRDPGDGSVRLAAGATVPSDEDLTAAVIYREPFVADTTAVLSDGSPVLDSRTEAPFLNEVVPEAYGDAAGHWFHPQAGMGALVGTSDDHRRATPQSRGRRLRTGLIERRV